MLTKKHFEAVAQILHRARNTTFAYNPVSFITEQLANYFQQENPSFDKERFRQAVGYLPLSESEENNQECLF